MQDALLRAFIWPYMPQPLLLLVVVLRGMPPASASGADGENVLYIPRPPVGKDKQSHLAF